MRKLLTAVAVLSGLVVALAGSAAADPVIAAAGDIACATTDTFYLGGNGDATHCAQKRTANVIGTIAPTAVLPLGDNQYNSGSLSQYNTVYASTWGRFKSISHPVPGNHEYGTSGAAGYFSYFGGLAGSSGKGWYSWSTGAWHMIALNNECSHMASGCGVGSPEETWLRNDLATHSNRCVLAYFHEPRFSSGSAPVTNATATAPLWNDLYDAGADVVLNGHKHFYERFQPLNKSGAVDTARGIREFIVGTGGKDHAGTPGQITGSVTLNARTFGVLRMSLHSTSYDWRFVGEPGSTYSDSGSGSCH